MRQVIAYFRESFQLITASVGNALVPHKLSMCRQKSILHLQFERFSSPNYNAMALNSFSSKLNPSENDYLLGYWSFQFKGIQNNGERHYDKK